MARFDFRLQKKLKLYINAGGFAGFLLSAKSVSTPNIKSSIHKFNAGVIGAIGLSISISLWKIFIEGGGNYGFINIQKYAADGSNYSGAATIHVAYLRALKRNNI